LWPNGRENRGQTTIIIPTTKERFDIMSRFKIDGVMNDEMVSQLASQVKNIPIELIKNFENVFEGDKEPEFYKGLLTGYVNGYNLVINQETSTEQLGAIVAFVASKIAK
jgi:hypothetical protein